MSCSCASPRPGDFPEYIDLASQGEQGKHLRVTRCQKCNEVHSESRQSHNYRSELSFYCVCGAGPK